MKAVKDKPALQGKEISIKRGEVNELLWVLNGIKTVHSSLVPTAAKFLAKNTDKLIRVQDKIEFGKKEVLEKFVDHDGEGRVVYWDKKVVSAEQTEMRAYLNEKKNVFMDAVTNEPVKPIQNETGQWVTPPLYPHFKDNDTEIEYIEAKNAFMEEEIKCHVIQMDDNFMTENRVQVPTRIQQPNGQGFIPLNINALWKYLIIDGDLDGFAETGE